MTSNPMARRMRPGSLYFFSTASYSAGVLWDCMHSCISGMMPVTGPAQARPARQYPIMAMNMTRFMIYLLS